MIASSQMLTRKTCIAGSVICLLAFGDYVVKADSLDDALNSCVSIADASLYFGTYQGEARACGLEVAAYLQQQALLLIPLVGFMQFAGTSISEEPAGSTASLTFQFIDPATGLPTSGPTVGFVDYQVNENPSEPGDFVDLGTSSSAASKFAIPFTVPLGTEPIFLAFPYGPDGKPIVITGTGGSNDAESFAFNATAVREPPVLWFLALASILFGAKRLNPQCFRRLVCALSRRWWLRDADGSC